jgi:hypothetical protein
MFNLYSKIIINQNMTYFMKEGCPFMFLIVEYPNNYIIRSNDEAPVDEIFPQPCNIPAPCSYQPS